MIEHSIWRKMPKHIDKRVFAIGDVHGCFNLLEKLVTELKTIDNTAQIIFVGDLIDRGPHSYKVLNYIKNGVENDNWIYLIGNHDLALIEILENKLKSIDNWISYGGGALLNELGINVAKFIKYPFPKQRLEIIELLGNDMVKFLLKTKQYYIHEINEIVFVHAGLDKNVPFDKQDIKDTSNGPIWIRYRTPPDPIHNKFIIHGHEPVRYPQLNEYGCNIDTGAYKWGTLTAVELYKDKLRFIISKE